MKQFFTLTIVFFAAFGSATAQESWPRTINGDDGSRITIYEPEPEYMSGDEFTGRAAVSIKKSANDEPVFGAILFTAALKNTKPSTAVQLSSFRITKMKVSGEDDDNALENLSSLVENDASQWNWGMTTDELKKKVAEEQQGAQGTGFNNAAPKIIYKDKPATLVVIDGDPRVLYDKDLATDKVVNSPNIIFKEKGKWNLYAGGNWYQSNSVTGNWKHNNNLSAKVRQVDTEIKKQEKENRGEETQSEDPRQTEILVSTVPAELIQTDGEPVYKNVAGTSLLYVSNSPNEIFKDINNQKTYILIAGRWYQGPGLNGPWSFVPADKLPEDFARIPNGSDKDAVLANVAGTDAAETAVLEAAIPQTAKVDRKTATINVEYDGAPQFNRIRGTSLSLAENSNVTVIRDADGYYFALDNGIWFISDDAYGPWSVANDRPKDIDDIPASSPAYHSRYVYVYDVMPDYVYMGYTPGYLGSYVYGPTVVYGTGFHYRPWFRRMYYPRPITWGFGFLYDPWYGWNFNFGYNYGFMYVGFNYGRPNYYGYGGGWFGPQRYCPSYRRPYWNDGYYRRGDYYGRRGDVYGSRSGRPDYGTAPSRNGRIYGRTGNNLYADQRGVSTTNLSRTPRLYRPGLEGSARTTYSSRQQRLRDGSESIQRPEGGRREVPRLNNPSDGGNRSEIQRPNINRGDRPTITDPQQTEGQRERQVQRPDVNRGERPTISNPSQREETRDGQIQRPDFNRGERPVITNPQRNENSAPRRVERPSIENRQSAPVDRPAIENRQPRQERPAIERSNANPAPRVNYERQQSAPAPRQNIERPAPAQRPAIENRSSGGSPRSSGEQSRRPDRR